VGQNWAAWRRGTVRVKPASSCRNLWQEKTSKKIKPWDFFNYISPPFHADTVCLAEGRAVLRLPLPLCLSEHFCGEISSSEFLVWLNSEEPISLGSTTGSRKHSRLPPTFALLSCKMLHMLISKNHLWCLGLSALQPQSGTCCSTGQTGQRGGLWALTGSYQHTVRDSPALPMGW